MKEEIEKLISLHAEGDYWDFKQQWHDNNANLLHDIICMANSPANRDSFIIFGVQDETFDIVGVSEENRKNQQNVIDFLRQKPKWAGGYIPEIYVKTIIIGEKEIDVLIVKQSNHTPFYLIEDYRCEKVIISKGCIYTRKGDTNTPKNSTADIYDTELLWKRRLGLLYNPSQRGKTYLKDLENWERVYGEDKFGIERFFFYYKPDPDYTIHFTEDNPEEAAIYNHGTKDINKGIIGSRYYYLFTFYNVSYHTDISDNEKVTLFYRDVPLFSSYIECIDEGRTKVIPPEGRSYYIKDSFRYLMFEFLFYYRGESYSNEARDNILKVVPVFQNEQEYNEFKKFREEKGYIYINENVPDIFNYANIDNQEYNEISKCITRGNRMVCSLKRWRNHYS